MGDERLAAIAVVGANWGDEGKGKMVDYLASKAEFVVRFQGGGNAGHTIINHFGKFALHLLPSGVFHTGVKNVIGPGVALDISRLLQELKNLKKHNVPEPQLLISSRAPVLLPVHMLLDHAEEELLGSNQFGSTRSGTAPFYADKALKIGIQVADLSNGERLRERLSRLMESGVQGDNVSRSVSNARVAANRGDYGILAPGRIKYSAVRMRYFRDPLWRAELRENHFARRPIGSSA